MKNIPQNITKAIIVNEETGEAIELFERPNRPCHFIPVDKRLQLSDMEVQFRLDWSDMNESGDPMLDADFIDPWNRKHLSKKIEGHHTDRLFDPKTGRYVYEFRHNGRRIVFHTQLTKIAQQMAKARIVRHYHGIVVDHSLVDGVQLGNEVIGSKRIGSWTLFKLQVIDDGTSLERFLSELQSKIRDGPWYAHFYNIDGSDVLVVFKTKVLRMNKDKASWQEAIQYGKTMGISVEQLDFTPNTFAEEAFWSLHLDNRVFHLLSGFECGPGIGANWTLSRFVQGSSVHLGTVSSGVSPRP